MAEGPQGEVEVGCELPGRACADGELLLTPARHGTDGFFVAVFERVAAP